MKKLILFVGLSLAALVFPNLSAAGETGGVGIGCFYDHPEGTPHNHPPSVWVEVTEGKPLTLHNEGGEGYTLTCEDWRGRKLAQVRAGKLHLTPEACCITTPEEGETCGFSAATSAGFCKAAGGDVVNATAVSCQEGARQWRARVPAEVTAGRGQVVCRDSHGRVVAEVKPGFSVSIETETCGFILPHGRLGGSAVLRSAYGSCRGV